MPFNQEAFEKVQADFAEKRRKSEAIRDEHRRILYARLPRVKEIEYELAQTGLSLARSLVQGGRSGKEALEELRRQNISLQQERAELLAANGYPPNYLEIPHECPQCGDTGYVGSKMCSCMRTALRREAYLRSNLGGSLQDQTFDAFDLSYYSDAFDPSLHSSPRQVMENILAICKQFAVLFPDVRPMLFIGATGLGKTFLSSAVALSLIDRGCDVIYDNAQNIFNKCEQQHFGRSKTDCIERYIHCDLLIIDDLGAEFRTQFTVSCLYNLLSSRIAAGRPMIISTNLKADEIQKIYSPRIASRLFGEFSTLHFVGSDIRMQKLMKMNNGPAKP